MIKGKTGSLLNKTYLKMSKLFWVVSTTTFSKSKEVRERGRKSPLIKASFYEMIGNC